MRSRAHGVVARARGGEQTKTARATAGRRRVEAGFRGERGRGRAASRWDARGGASNISRGVRAGPKRTRVWRGGASRRHDVAESSRRAFGKVLGGGEKNCAGIRDDEDAAAIARRVVVRPKKSGFARSVVLTCMAREC